MKRNVILGILVLLCTLVFVVPAQAVVIGGVDYVLYGRCKIGLEGGGTPPTLIEGNVRVAQVCGSPQGFLQIGNGVTINGTASANRMSGGTGATVTGACEFNVDVGGAAAACQDGESAFIPDASWPPAACPVPLVTPGTNDFICGAPGNPSPCNPPAGQYKKIDVLDGAVLNLDGGTYQAATLNVQTDATLNGNGSTVNLTGTFTTEPRAIIKNVNITSIGSGGAMTTGNATQVTDSFFNAPNGGIHLRQKGTYQRFEACGNTLTVEPNRFPDGGDTFCACPTGFHFAVETCTPETSCTEGRRCEKD